MLEDFIFTVDILEDFLKNYRLEASPMDISSILNSAPNSGSPGSSGPPGGSNPPPGGSNPPPGGSNAPPGNNPDRPIVAMTALELQNYHDLLLNNSTMPSNTLGEAGSTHENIRKLRLNVMAYDPNWNSSKIMARNSMDTMLKITNTYAFRKKLLEIITVTD